MNTPFDPTLESDIKELMKEVPPQVKAVFVSGKIETVAKNLMQKYKFHIDQGAVVEREIILLLLGLKNPNEFIKTLAEEAKLDQQIINNVVRDVNEQIFVPLREEMKKAPPAPAVPKPPMPVPPQARQQSDLRSVLASITVPRDGRLTSLNPAPSIQPPASRLLEDHEEPHIEFQKPVVSDKVQGASPPANLPGAIYHPSLNNPRATPSDSDALGSGLSGDRSAEQNGLASPPSPPKPIPPTPLKPYSDDPYREPVDEK